MLPCNISPLWQSLVNEHHMLPCNISPSGNPSWTSIICYRATFPPLAIPHERHHMLPCNISPSGNPSWTSIICYRATFPPLAIPRERASYVTVQHFPLWQSLVNEHHMLPCNISPLAIPRERASYVTVQHFPSLAIPHERASYVTVQHFPPLAIPHERASYVTVQHFPLWQSLMNEHHMLPCNISPSLVIPHERHHMLPCNISPLWQSLVNEHHMLPCNISPSGNPSWTSIICYRATFPPLAIPHERHHNVTVQHFPLWQSLVNKHHMLPCNISPSGNPSWTSIICYRATFPPLAIPRERASYVTVQHFPLWQSLVNEHHMLPCNISPLWQSLMNEHHMLLCNISPSGNPSWTSIICYCATFPPLAIPHERASYVTVQHCPLSGNPSWTASYVTVQHFPFWQSLWTSIICYCATFPPLW